MIGFEASLTHIGISRTGADIVLAITMMVFTVLFFCNMVIEGPQDREKQDLLDKFAASMLTVVLTGSGTALLCLGIHGYVIDGALIVVMASNAATGCVTLALAFVSAKQLMFVEAMYYVYTTVTLTVLIAMVGTLTHFGQQQTYSTVHQTLLTLDSILWVCAVAAIYLVAHRTFSRKHAMRRSTA